MSSKDPDQLAKSHNPIPAFVALYLQWRIQRGLGGSVELPLTKIFVFMGILDKSDKLTTSYSLPNLLFYKFVLLSNLL